MVPGLLGKKLGMTQIWDDNEVVRPATVIELGPCVVLQVKTLDKDGYSAIQLGFDEKPFRRKHGKGERRRTVERRGATRAELGHARAANTTPKRFVREVHVAPGHAYELGQQLTVELFAGVSHVDIKGTSKGKGFQGTVKRHRFTRGAETHGSMNVRQPGSIGGSSWPSRVFPGTRMSGHMGDDKHTEQNVRVVKIDTGRNLLIVNGAVPGPTGGYLVVLPGARMLARKKA